MILIASANLQNEISRLFEQAYEQGEIGGDKFLKPYTKAQLKIESLGTILQKKIAEYTKTA